MIVTNEQAKADIECEKHKSCSCCEYFMHKVDRCSIPCNEKQIEDYAADLLEARAEIERLQKELASGIIVQTTHLLEKFDDARAERDKAIAMIREMREGLEIGLNALQAQGWTRHRDDEIALIESLLEKSKEYEEG